MWIVLAGPLSNHALYSGDHRSETGKGNIVFGNLPCELPCAQRLILRPQLADECPDSGNKRQTVWHIHVLVVRALLIGPCRLVPGFQCQYGEREPFPSEHVAPPLLLRLDGP